VVTEIVGENRGEIGAENHDAARSVDPLGDRREAFGVQRILERLEVLQIAKDGIARKSIGGTTTEGPLLHGIERGSKSEREFVKMALKMFVGFETEAMDDPDDGGRISAKPLRESAHAEEYIFAGVLEDGPDDLLTFGAEFFDALPKMNVVSFWSLRLWHNAIVHPSKYKFNK
jgi:hypothetical protein